jgi:hypothetical protein
MRFVVVLTLVFLAMPSPSSAWGFEAHRFIADQMIALLPAEIRAVFAERRAALIERAVDPDLWRNIFPEEDPNHFVDLDYYGKYPFSELPHEYDRAVAKWGRETVHQQGLAPWRAAEIFGKLQREFEALKRENAPAYLQDNIVFYAAVLAHYVGDAHVPLHAVVNYDGQNSNQRGVHGRWESDLFERTRSRIKVAPPAPRPVADPREFVFEALLASNRLAEAVLESDRHAAEGREFYDEEYFKVFEKEQFPALEARVNDSIAAITSLVIAAWDAAGRPPIPPAGPRSPRPIPRPKG